jgi:hypothetical protein
LGVGDGRAGQNTVSPARPRPIADRLGFGYGGTMSTTILQIRKDHLPTTRWHERADEPLAPGQVRVRIDRFALTSNNITYAAFGEAMNYWRFYPTGEEGWGVIPVWGFATVVESTHPEVPVGERVYGYFPMASHTVLTPVRVSAGGWADGAPHRAELHPVYNQLTRCATDPFYTPDTEDVQALLRPLFITSWLIDDFLADNDFFGARVMRAVQRVEQDRLWHRLPAGPARGDRGGRPDLAGQCGFLRKSGLL